MPAPLSSKDEIVASLLEIFRRDGYDGATLGALSRATGLGRSSLYHYFPGGKEEMLEEVLDALGVFLHDEIVAPLAKGSAAPAQRLQHMLAKVSAYYDDGAKACLLNRAAASVDRARFQKRVAKLFAAFIEALAACLREAGVARAAAHARAEDAIIRIEGALVLAEGCGDRAPFQRTMRSLRAELLAVPGGARPRAARGA